MYYIENCEKAKHWAVWYEWYYPINAAWLEVVEYFSSRAEAIEKCETLRDSMNVGFVKLYTVCYGFEAMF